MGEHEIDMGLQKTTVSFLAFNHLGYSYLEHDRHIITLGATVVLIALAIDPFTQQLIQFNQQTEFIAGASSAIARAQRYSLGNVFVLGVSVPTRRSDLSAYYAHRT
jgi:hypothetical protein